MRSGSGGRGRCSGCCCRGGGASSTALDGGDDVVTGDPTAGTRSANLRRIESVLGDELAHHRRQNEPFRAAHRRRVCLRRSGLNRRGCGHRCGSRRRSRSGRCGGSGCLDDRCRRGDWCRSTCSVADNCDDGADRDRVALCDADLGQHAGDRGRNLGVDLVGRDLEQRLVGRDGFTHLLEEAGDGSLGDGFAELRERDLCHGSSFTS